MIKLTTATAIFALLFSCSKTEEPLTPEDAANATITVKSTSDLVESTITYYETIEAEVKSKRDLDHAKSLTEALVNQYAEVLTTEGGIEEVAAALAILEDLERSSARDSRASDCIKPLRSCVRGHLFNLLLYVQAGADPVEAVDLTVNLILECVIDYIKCEYF